MGENDGKGPDHKGLAADHDGLKPLKRPYVAPAVAWSEPINVATNLAAACGKIEGNLICEGDTAS